MSRLCKLEHEEEEEVAENDGFMVRKRILRAAPEICEH